MSKSVIPLPPGAPDLYRRLASSDAEIQELAYKELQQIILLGSHENIDRVLSWTPPPNYPMGAEMAAGIRHLAMQIATSHKPVDLYPDPADREKARKAVGDVMDATFCMFAIPFAGPSDIAVPFDEVIEGLIQHDLLHADQPIVLLNEWVDGDLLFSAGPGVVRDTMYDLCFAISETAPEKHIRSLDFTTDRGERSSIVVLSPKALRWADKLTLEGKDTKKRWTLKHKAPLAETSDVLRPMTQGCRHFGAMNMRFIIGLSIIPARESLFAPHIPEHHPEPEQNRLLDAYNAVRKTFTDSIFGMLGDPENYRETPLLRHAMAGIAKTLLHLEEPFPPALTPDEWVRYIEQRLFPDNEQAMFGVPGPMHEVIKHSATIMAERMIRHRLNQIPAFMDQGLRGEMEIMSDGSYSLLFFDMSGRRVDYMILPPPTGPVDTQAIVEIMHRDMVPLNHKALAKQAFLH